MLHNFTKLKFLLSFFDWLGRFNIVVLVLLSVEASRLKILHRLFAVFASSVIVLQISKHSLVTSGVERFLRSGRQVGKLGDVTAEWVFENRFLEVVPEVADKSLSVVELDKEGLCVDW